MSNDAPYKCTKCGQRFVHENRYLAHHCKQMKREEMFKEAIGQSAWMLYQKWMRSYGKAAPNASAFLSSKYFNSFVRFAEFVKKTRMVDVDLFIAIMKDRDIAPVLWTNDQVYALYLEHIDKKLAPERHVEITINTLFDYADDNEVDVSEIFNVLTPNDVIQLLRERRLSPWVLLNSSKFKEFFTKKTSGEHRVILESLIRPTYWKAKFAANPELVKQMRVYVSELKL